MTSGPPCLHTQERTEYYWSGARARTSMVSSRRLSMITSTPNKFAAIRFLDPRAI